MSERGSRWRFLVEGVVIVVSILLAFAIDAAWDRFEERGRAREYAEALLEDGRANLARLDDAREGTAEIVAAAKELGERIKTDIPSSEADTVLLLVVASFAIQPFEPVTQGYNQIVAVGELGLLSSVTRSALTSWNTELAIDREHQRQSQQDRHQSYAPFMIEETSLRMAFGFYDPAGPFGESAFPARVEDLVRNRRLDNLLTYRVGYAEHRLSGFDNMRGALEGLLVALEGEVGGER